MKLRLVIFSFLSFILFTSTAKPKCFRHFKYKDNGMLFQNRVHLYLNNDSTFLYAQNSCTSNDSSWGTWSIDNHKLKLTTNQWILEKIKNQKPFEFEKYIDLSKAEYFYWDSTIVLNHGYLDTLERE